MENQRDFCTECRRETNYTLKKIKINQTIRKKEYTFEITVAFCNECGGEMGVPGLLDYNIKEIDEQYHSFRALICIWIGMVTTGLHFVKNGGWITISNQYIT